MPVWHVSVSAWSRRTERRQDVPRVCEREAVRLLRGVGGDREWWFYNQDALIGHLRVGLTGSENDSLPRYCGATLDDAGESGPERMRTGER